MTEQEWRALITTVSLIIQVLLIVAILLRQFMRILRHAQVKITAPDLLWRDATMFAALAFLIVVPTIAFAFGITLSDQLWWVALRGAVGIFVLAEWAYYEFLVIGKQLPEEPDERDSESRINKVDSAEGGIDI